MAQRCIHPAPKSVLVEDARETSKCLSSVKHCIDNFLEKKKSETFFFVVEIMK